MSHRSCRFGRPVLTLALLMRGWCASLAHAETCAIDHIEKMGVGGVPISNATDIISDTKRVGARWFYNWRPTIDRESGDFVPMIWSGRDVPMAKATSSGTLLTFNEPDSHTQANMPVDLALAYWPALMASGKRLSSPAVTSGRELDEQGWLKRFMVEAERLHYRVDFMAVHYYSTDADVEAFRSRLTDIHLTYNRPIWVTEWGLADWPRPGRFSFGEQASFLRRGAEMLDRLPFVERHAWFGLYEGQDGWALHSGLVLRGIETTVGIAFSSLAGCDPATSG